MHLFAKILLLISLTITASGCSNFSMPKVPKFDGSFIKLPEVYKITQDMIDKLKPGMTKVQVKFIMGTPLIADTFNQNRWDYFYGMKPAKGPEVRERMAIFFKDDKLSSLRGDFMPNQTSNEPIE